MRAQSSLCASNRATTNMITTITEEIMGLRGSSRKPITKPFEWVRYDRFRVTNDVLFGEGEPVRYISDSMDELPDSLIAVVDSRSAVSFATRYGLLGRTQILDRAARAAFPETLRLRIDRTRPVSPIVRGVPGESLAWIFAHARTLLAIRYLWLTLDQFNSSRSNADLRQYEGFWMREPLAVLADFALFESVETEQREKLEGANIWAEINCDPQLLNFVLSVLVNGNISGAHPRVETTPTGTLLTSINVPTLIEMAYWLEWQKLTKGELGLCEECGNLFNRRDAREKYCRRQCRLKFAQRRFRAQHRTSAQKKRGGT